jgi:hypothetical protein
MTSIFGISDTFIYFLLTLVSKDGYKPAVHFHIITVELLGTF